MSKLICLKCSKPIASLKSNRCTYCSTPIPESMRLTPEERRRLGDEDAAEDERSREKLKEDWPVSPTRYLPDP